MHQSDVVLISVLRDEGRTPQNPVGLWVRSSQQEGDDEVGAVPRGGEHPCAGGCLIQRGHVARVREGHTGHGPQPEHGQGGASLSCKQTNLQLHSRLSPSHSHSKFIYDSESQNSHKRIADFHIF